MIKRLLILIIILSTGLHGIAQDVSFTMSAPNVISEGAQFRLTFSTNKDGSNLKLPDLSAFNILMGPSPSQQNSVEIINGKVTQSATYNYLYILQAKSEGEFTIQPASIDIDGKTYQSNSLKIQVVKGNAPQQGGQSATQPGQQGRTSSELSKEDIFVRIELSKSNVYKGDQIIATIKIYVAPDVNLAGFDNAKIPAFEGFWSQEIPVPNQINFERQAYNNRIYQVGVLKKTILIPQQTGNIRIEPFEITCLIRQQVRRQRSIFDDFFDNSFQTVQARVISDPVNVSVRDLPPAPAGFYGGVGNLRYTASIDKTQAKTNEAITLKVEVSGNGNLRLIEAPKINFPIDFETYDPKTTERIVPGQGGTSGSKTFEYLFIPRNAGDYTISPIALSYFNTSTNSYTTTYSPEFKLHIEKGDESQNVTVTSSLAQEDLKLLGQDIRYIKQDQYKLKHKSALFFGSSLYWGIMGGSLLLFFIVVLIYRKQLKENSNIQLVKTKKASKMARKRLKEARSFMKQNKVEQFHEAVLKAFWGYLSDKLNIPVSDLNRENVTGRLTAGQVSQGVISEFIELLDTCEFYRYAPGASNETPHEIYDKAAEIMGKLEKQIRK